MVKQDTIRTLVRFGLVGGGVALVHSGLIWYFYHQAGFGARASYWIGYPPAVTLHFVLTKWWTFRCARRDLVRQMIRYALVALIAGAVQFGIYHLALMGVTSLPNLAYVIAAAVQMGLSFALMRQKVFGAAVAPEAEPAA
ncbi:MAG: GtrA family protein [Opitutaceae bacterium]